MAAIDNLIRLQEQRCNGCTLDHRCAQGRGCSKPARPAACATCPAQCAEPLADCAGPVSATDKLLLVWIPAATWLFLAWLAWE